MFVHRDVAPLLGGAEARSPVSLEGLRLVVVDWGSRGAPKSSEQMVWNLGQWHAQLGFEF